MVILCFRAPRLKVKLGGVSEWAVSDWATWCQTGRRFVRLGGDVSDWAAGCQTGRWGVRLGETGRRSGVSQTKRM
jgi:hypothetical protein